MSRRNLWTGLAITLLIAFTLPTWIGLMAWASGQLPGDHPLGRQFFLMLFETTPVWELVRIGLGVVVVAIAGLGLGDKLPLRASVVVVALLVAFAGIGSLFIILLDPLRSGEIWQLADQTLRAEPVESSIAFYTRWNAYLREQCVGLAAHLALFLGLTWKSAVGGSASPPAAAPTPGPTDPHDDPAAPAPEEKPA